MYALAAGDEDAFAQLMQRHLPVVTATAQRMLGNAAEADEVAQETFLRLWRHAPDWRQDAGATVRSWLLRVGINLSLDHLRRRRSVPLEHEELIEDERPSAEENYERQQQREQIQQALLKLPERQRSVMVLAYFEDMTAGEVATVTGQSRSAVEALLVRARRNMRNYLAQAGWPLEGNAEGDKHE